jgi:hypothetical protein
MTPTLLPITQELLYELKARGQWEEADRLLKAYHEDRRKAKRQLSLEIQRQDRAKINFFKQQAGLCLYSSCKQPARPNRTLCTQHAKLKREAR